MRVELLKWLGNVRGFRWIKNNPRKVVLIAVGIFLLGIPVLWAFYVTFLLGRYTRGLSLSVRRKKNVTVYDRFTGETREATDAEQAIIDSRPAQELDPRDLVDEDNAESGETAEVEHEAKSLGLPGPDQKYFLEKEKQ